MKLISCNECLLGVFFGRQCFRKPTWVACGSLFKYLWKVVDYLFPDGEQVPFDASYPSDFVQRAKSFPSFISFLANLWPLPSMSLSSFNCQFSFFIYFYSYSAHFKHSLHSSYLLTSFEYSALTPNFIVSFPHTRSNLQITSLIHISACLFYEQFIERLDRGGRTAHLIAQGGNLLENGWMNCFGFMFLGS